MNGIAKTLARALLVLCALAAGGCGTLATPPVLALSVASTVVGGYANGAVLGGSTVGVIRNAAFDDGEHAQPTTAVAATPSAADGLARACYFPNASGRGLPCT